jgi:hypothetical protein
MKLNALKMTATVALLSSAALAQAKEGGDQYPNGVENWMAGALPPPGNYFIGYTGYWQGTLRNGRGGEVDFGGGQHAKLNATYEALRFIKVTRHTILGASYGWHVIVPLVNLSIDHPALGGRASEFNVGDITLDPLVLGWHTGNLHTTFGLDFLFKTGHYDAADPRVSIGTHYNSIEPVLAVTWLNPEGWEASAKFMYNIKAKNEETRYQSGDEFHVDWLLGKTSGAWGVGLAGYYLKQTTDDEQYGQTVAAIPGVWSEGRRGQVFAFGPSVKYTTRNGVMLVGQWQKETALESRFGDDKFLLKAIVPL